MRPMTEEFVVGFAFTPDDRVLLIEKTHPRWQAGLLNGIGGRIEVEETPEQAMNRESIEEADLHLEWTERARITGPYFDVYVFYAISSKVRRFRQMTGEPLGIYRREDLDNYPHVSNVPYLVAFGRAVHNKSFDGMANPYITLDYGRMK